MKNAPTLVKPGPDLEEAFREMNEEFLGEPYYREYSDFSQLLQRFATDEVQPADPAYVPMSVFWLQSENSRLLGEVRFRHQLNATLEHEGGNIGYNIRPRDRGKGYGTLILGLMLDHARNLGQQLSKSLAIATTSLHLESSLNTVESFRVKVCLDGPVKISHATEST